MNVLTHSLYCSAGNQAVDNSAANKMIAKLTALFAIRIVANNLVGASCLSGFSRRSIIAMSADDLLDRSSFKSFGDSENKATSLLEIKALTTSNTNTIRNGPELDHSDAW